jgi:hypothetical protein
MLYPALCFVLFLATFAAAEFGHHGRRYGVIVVCVYRVFSN